MFLNMLSGGSSWDFSLANYTEVWEFIIQLGLLLLFMLFGHLIRNNIPFLRKSFIPSPLIGGALLLATHYICDACGFTLVKQQVMQVITYHSLGIGFVAMSLKINKKDSQKKLIKKSVQNGVMTGATYMLQAVLGIACTIGLFYLTKKTDNPTYYTSGLLLPLSFGQGPGNAMTWGLNFSNAMDPAFIAIVGDGRVYHFEDMGLMLASIGFVAACVGGVIYINIFKHKGQITHKNLDLGKRSGDVFEDEDEIPDVDSMDKLSVQLCFVALGYAISFGIMAGLGAISDFTNSIAWGFNFIWGVIAANLIKIFLRTFRKKKLMKKKYINNYQMDRISGFFFDLMIIAGFSAIDMPGIKNYILPIILLSVIGFCATFFYVRIITKRCFKGFEHEAFVVNFGTLTGTASNGMSLLKEIDPNFETPASNIFVISQLPAMIAVAPLLLFLSFASKDMKHLLISMGIFFILFIGYTTFLLISSRKKVKEEAK